MAVQNKQQGSISIPSIPAPAYSSIAGAITGLVLWSLATYAFRNHTVPGPVEGAAWVLIPSIVSGVASHVTRKHTKP